MIKIQTVSLLPLPSSLRDIVIIAFLALLGSHLLDYHPWFFVMAAFVLTQWERVFSKESLILLILLLSIYGTWIFIDNSIAHDYRLLGQGALLLMAYLLGLSVSIPQGPKQLKILFYLLFAFFAAYTLSILYSYIFIDQDHPLTINGMFVIFQNEYQRLNVHGGRLWPTIIAYYLTFMAIALPLLLVYWRRWIESGFGYLEIVLLSTLSLFALYISNETGRRTVLLLFVFSFLYLLLAKSIQALKRGEHKQTLIFIGIIVISAAIGYWLIADTTAIKRISHLGIHDRRFSWWGSGLQAMLDYPFGGGHKVWMEANYTKLAHNTWIDIGKDFGIIPFIFSILWFLLHYYYLVRVLLSKQAPEPIKNILFIIAASFTAILMIEPVFTSDKTFIAYIFFYFGFLKRYSDMLYSKAQLVSKTKPKVQQI